MQTRSHRLHGARQENCTAEDKSAAGVLFVVRGGKHAPPVIPWGETGGFFAAEVRPFIGMPRCALR